MPAKVIFNKIVGEPHSGGFELSFAAFLEARTGCRGLRQELPRGRIQARLRQKPTATFPITRQTSSSAPPTELSGSWKPKAAKNSTFPQKMARLKQWCADATAAEENGQRYNFVFVDQIGFDKHAPKTFARLGDSFLEYRTESPQGMSKDSGSMNGGAEKGQISQSNRRGVPALCRGQALARAGRAFGWPRPGRFRRRTLPSKDPKLHA